MISLKKSFQKIYLTYKINKILKGLYRFEKSLRNKENELYNLISLILRRNLDQLYNKDFEIQIKKDIALEIKNLYRYSNEEYKKSFLDRIFLWISLKKVGVVTLFILIALLPLFDLQIPRFRQTGFDPELELNQEKEIVFLPEKAFGNLRIEKLTLMGQKINNNFNFSKLKTAYDPEPVQSGYYFDYKGEEIEFPSSITIYKREKYAKKNLIKNEESYNNLINITNQYIKNTKVNMDNYGDPFIEIMKNEKKSLTKKIEVVYPLIIDDKKVYNSSGIEGIKISIDLNNLYVENIENIYEYTKSNYPAKTNTADVINEINQIYFPDSNKNKLDEINALILGTPKTALIKYDYLQRELIIPSLIFPIKKSPNSIEINNQEIIFPLIK